MHRHADLLQRYANRRGISTKLLVVRLLMGRALTKTEQSRYVENCAANLPMPSCRYIVLNRGWLRHQARHHLSHMRLQRDMAAAERRRRLPGKGSDWRRVAPIAVMAVVIKMGTMLPRRTPSYTSGRLLKRRAGKDAVAMMRLIFLMQKEMVAVGLAASPLSSRSTLLTTPSFARCLMRCILLGIQIPSTFSIICSLFCYLDTLRLPVDIY
mmetsp:Transcript_36980/g.80997  ORF Transcript_36980/g.80997 Transcript_36980/m.80997 type:complete len:211 (+) Transcript_36980:615-1247(+)